MAKKTEKAPKKAQKREKPAKVAIPVVSDKKPVSDVCDDLMRRFGAVVKDTTAAHDAIRGCERIKRAIKSNTVLRDC